MSGFMLVLAEVGIGALGHFVLDRIPVPRRVDTALAYVVGAALVVAMAVDLMPR